MSSANEDIGVELANQLDRLLARELTREMRVAAEAGSFDSALWDAIVGLGTLITLVPEAAGGAGLRASEAVAILQLLGRHLPPLPIGETMLARWLLAASGIAVNDEPIAIVSTPLDLDRDGNVSGEDASVSWAPVVRSALALARSSHGQHLVLLDIEQCTGRACRTIDRLPAATLRCSSVRPTHISTAPAVLGSQGLGATLATLRAQQISAALEHVLTLSVDYANARVQFGKTLGRFQVIQHQLAELAEHVAAAKVSALYALRQLDSGQADRAERGAAVAKIRCGTAATRGAAIAHQLFGAIGITDEHSLHDYTRRLWQWRDDAGSEAQWAEWLGSMALAHPGEMLWRTLTQ